MQAQEAEAVVDTPNPLHRPHRFTPEQSRRANEVKQAKRKTMKPNPTPTLSTSQVIDSTYKDGIQEWIKIASTFRKDIRAAQRSGDKKGVVAILTAAGIAWDKAYPKKVDDDSVMVAPQPVVSRLIELAASQSVPNDNNNLGESLHYDSYPTQGDSVEGAAPATEAGGGGLRDGTPAP